MCVCVCISFGMCTALCCGTVSLAKLCVCVCVCFFKAKQYPTNFKHRAVCSCPSSVHPSTLPSLPSRSLDTCLCVLCFDKKKKSQTKTTAPTRACNRAVWPSHCGCGCVRFHSTAGTARQQKFTVTVCIGGGVEKLRPLCTWSICWSTIYSAACTSGQVHGYRLVSCKVVAGGRGGGFGKMHPCVCVCSAKGMPKEGGRVHCARHAVLKGNSGRGWVGGIPGK